MWPPPLPTGVAVGVGPALGREQDCCKGGTDVTGAERIPDSGLHWGLTQLTDRGRTFMFSMGVRPLCGPTLMGGRSVCVDRLCWEGVECGLRLLQRVSPSSCQRAPSLHARTDALCLPSTLRASALPRQSMDSITRKLSVGSEKHEFGDQAWKAKLM